MTSQDDSSANAVRKIPEPDLVQAIAEGRIKTRPTLARAIESGEIWNHVSGVKCALSGPAPVGGLTVKRPNNRAPKTIGAILLREPNWRAAEDFARDQNERLEAAKGKSAITFNEAADAYITACEQRSRAKDPTISPGTVDGYRIALSKSRARFGTMRLADLESHMVQDWLDEQAVSYKRSTLGNHYLALDQVMKFATRRKMIPFNPLLADPVKVKGTRTKRVDIPDRSDMERLREYINGPRPYKHSRLTWSSMRVAIALAGTCGLRAGEVCGLRWDRIDPDNGTINVTDVVSGNRVRPWPKSDAGLRTVPLSLRAREIIDEHAVIYRQFFGKCVGHLVRNDRKGEFIVGARVGEMLKVIMVEARLVKEDGRPKFTFHALRHWCASHWMRSTNGDVHLVAKWIGHKNASVTLNVYGHCLDDKKGREEFLRMPDWLDPLVELGAPEPAVMLPPPPRAELIVVRKPVVDPIPVPEDCDRWVRMFIADLWSTGDVRAALRSIGRTRYVVSAGLRRWELPPINEILEMAREAALTGGAVAMPAMIAPPAPIACPIDVPDHADEWVRRYIGLLDQGMTSTSACEAVRRDRITVRNELRRLALPDAKHAGDVRELKRRLWQKRVVALHDAGYQATEIAARAGGHQVQVLELLRALRRTNVPKGLKTQEHLQPAQRVDARPEHKKQLKLF